MALDRHLSAHKTAGLLDTWHAGRLLGGDDTAAELGRQLEKATLVVLLVSADFLAGFDQAQLAALAQMEPEGVDQSTAWTYDPAIPADVVAGFHRAAARLYRAAPWDVVPDDGHVLGLDVPKLGGRAGAAACLPPPSSSA